MRIVCPKCKVKLTANPEQYGKNATCPTCGTLIAIPSVGMGNIELAAASNHNFSSTQIDNNNLIQCPFCAEAIRPEATKCRFCGEWLKEPSGRLGTGPFDTGSIDARAVAKGIKKKELDEQTMGCMATISIIAGIVIGIFIGNITRISLIGWIVGIAVFILGISLSAAIYYKE